MERFSSSTHIINNNKKLGMEEEEEKKGLKRLQNPEGEKASLRMETHYLLISDSITSFKNKID